MKGLILSAFFLFFIGCSSVSDMDEDVPVLDNIPNKWKTDYENDYGIDRVWPTSIDSSMYYLIDEFNNNNKDILLLDLKENISLAYYNMSKSLLFPEFSARISVDESQQNVSSLPFEVEEDSGLDDLLDSGSLKSTTGSFKFSTRWELDLWGRIRDSKKSSFYSMMSDSYDIFYAKASLRGQFIKLYLSIVEVKEQIGILEDNLANLLSIKEISEKRVLKGISSPDEVYIASANYYRYQSELTILKYQYQKLVQNISLLLGRYLDGLGEINFKYPDDIHDFDDNISSNLLQRRPDILSAKSRIFSSHLKLRSDKKILFPSIQLSGSVGPLSKLGSSSDLKNLTNEDFLTWNFGLGILEPIFKGGQIKNNIKISEFNLHSSELEYVKIVMNSIYEADDFIGRDANLEDVYLEISQSKKDIEKAVEYAKNSYELGLVDLMYLLNTQQQLYAISIQENRVLSDRYRNKIDLILSIGGSLEY
tara:strand:- start:3708 stop:5141 length:1434 start_codon:yes stop_codon:yes gene_type:complete